MTALEFVVIACGLFGGYWIVSKLFSRATPRQSDTADPIPRAKTIEPAWYEVLGLSPQAGAEEIREVYKRLISQYHPDKVDMLGQELKDLAQRKSQEITAAYRQAMMERG